MKIRNLIMRVKSGLRPTGRSPGPPSEPGAVLGLNVGKPARRVVVAVVGGTVLAIGVAMIVLPGPAFIVIPAGLAILAIEFAWARRWLHKARQLFRNAFKRNEQA